MSWCCWRQPRILFSTKSEGSRG